MVKTPGHGGLDVPEGHLSYLTSGDHGPAVVLLHGAGFDNNQVSWARLGRELSEDHRVFAPDLPGHGESRPWNACADGRGLEDVTLRLLDHWGLRSATLIGLSLGAAIAMGTALRAPSRVDRLILVSSGGIQDRVPHHELSYLMTKRPMTWLFGLILRRPAVARRFIDGMPFTDDVGERERRQLEDLIREEAARRRGQFLDDWQRLSMGPRRSLVDFRPGLRRISCPTLFVHGRDDALVPLRYAQDAASRVEGARLAVIEGAGHTAPLDHPAQVGQVIREFLDATSPGHHD
ncbi:MAG: hypothetical protein QG608_3331 [Actinomycetota bacterium]|nr:hypothetical protein [Actinomycetota bacterium]